MAGVHAAEMGDWPSRRALVALVAAAVLTGALVGSGSAAAVPLHSLTPSGCVGALTPAAAHECGESNETRGLSRSDAPVVSPDGRSVYVVGYQDDALVRFDRGAGGGLTPAGCIGDVGGPHGCGTEVPGLDGGYGAALSPDGGSLYVAGYRDDAIVRFHRASDGALTPAGCIGDIGGTHGCGAGNETAGLDGAWWVGISPDGTSLYVASTLDNAIVNFRRAPDGSLTPAGCVGDSGGGHGCATESPGLRGARAVTVSPDGRSVYATGFLDSAVARFDRSTDGSLALAGCLGDVIAAQAHECGEANEVDGINGAWGVAVSPDGGSVYVAAHSEDAVARFDRAPDGALAPRGCIGDVSASAHPCGEETETAGLDGALQVLVSGDGRSLYVASYLDSAVVHFIRGTDGALSAVGCLGDAVDPGAHECGEAKEAPGLAGARALTLDPEGGSLYVAGHQDNAVALIQREVPPRCGPTWSTGGADTAQAIALNCIDPNGDPTAITIVSGPAHGSVTGPEPGGRDVVYIPHAGYSGVDGFSYGAQADGKDSELGWATVFVLLPEPPQPASVQPEEHVLPSLLALLALDRYTVRRGRRLTIRFAASAPGAVAFTISRSKRPLVTIRRTLKRAGVGAVKWSGKVAGRRRGLGPGRYALALSITSADGRVATDSAKLTVKR